MKWIDFKDKLPEEGQEIVVSEIYRGGTTGFITGKFNKFPHYWLLNTSRPKREASELIMQDEDWICKWASLTDEED